MAKPSCNVEERKPWEDEDIIRITRSESESLRSTHRHAAHAMFFSTSDKKLFGRIPMLYNILMTIRFDGYFGFPGGLIDKDSSGKPESLEFGLNRELKEEINLKERLFVKEEDYFRSFNQAKRRIVSHFYVKEVSEKDFRIIEKGALDAIEWGKETLGITRVPLQPPHNDHHHKSTGPFGIFLGNQFIGNARQELIEGIIHRKIMTESEFMRIWNSM